MPYIFDHLFAADESNPSNVARNGTITIFVPGDTTMTPVTGLKHIDGRPYPNPVTVNANGYAAQPVHETIDRLAWSGGGFSGVMTAYEGIKEEAVAARAAAENAAAEAATAATAEVEARIAAGDFQGTPGKDGANVLPTSEAIAQAVTTEGPAKAALSATIGDKVQPSLKRWKAKLAGEPATAKILLIGDSTSDPATDAGALLDRLKNVHTLPGEGLEGMDPANIISHGRNGSKLVSEWMVNTAWTDAAVAAAPDLIVFSLGINDMREGIVSSEQMRTSIITYLGGIMARLPNADFVLRTPNSFTTDHQGGQTAVWVVPTDAAQLYSTRLREVYGSLADQWPNAVVWDSQDRIFGRTSQLLADTRGLMKDQLHPSRHLGYPLIADYLVADVIGHGRKGTYTQLRPVDMLQASRPANPYILGDLMDRADSATSPGTASSGQSWTVTSGTMGIINKRLYAPTAGGNSARLEVGTNKFEAGITFTALDGGSSNDQYFFFRYNTVANSMGIRSYANTRWELVRWVSGAITVLASDVVNLPANGDRIRVINEAEKYKVYVNDRLMFSGAESANSALTGIGVHTGTTGTRWVDAWARKLPMP
jgi:lysophospholipase L1-like esterase